MDKFLLDNLTGKMVRRLLTGLMAGIFSFLIIYFGCSQMLNRYFYTSGSFYNAEKGRAGELQKYVSEKRISAMDSQALRTWAEERNIQEFTVSRDNLLLFDVSYAGDILPGGKKVSRAGWRIYFSVSFADGDAEVYLYEGYGKKYYGVLFCVAIFSGISICLGIFASKMQTDVIYIRLLEKEVRSVSQGNLEEDITVKGKDELAKLALGLDQMRRQLLERKLREQEMRQAQDRLVLGMSHDVRTPLTGLLTYMEILKKQDVGNEIREYIDKAYDKVLQIRRMSDQTFEYFLVNSMRETILEEPEEIASAFGDYLSELCSQLECDGFTVNTEALEWRPLHVRINEDHLGRIMNNIISNLEKYADRDGEIRIQTLYEKELVGILVENKTASQTCFVQGTGIGMKNVELMMKQMNGKLKVEFSEERYCVVLYFPVWKTDVM